MIAQKLTVETGVPIPSPRRSVCAPRYPWDEMAVGDSFLVPIGKSGLKSVKAARSALSASLSYAQTKGRVPKDFRIITRSSDEGLRVWRVKRTPIH